MDNKRPYDDLLKNLFHEQAAEIIPLLLPDFHVEEVFDIEMPNLKSFPLERPPTPLEEGIVGLAIPQAKVVQVYRTEWIEHSGTYERAYRITNSETDKPCFLVVEVQTVVAEDNHLANHLLSNFVSIDRHIRDDILAMDEDEDATEEMADEETESFQSNLGDPHKDLFQVELPAENTREVNDDEPSEADAASDEISDEEAFWGKEEGKGTIINTGYYNYHFALCPFPSQVPRPIRNEFMGRVMLAFNFKTIDLWERDAREFLNSHAYPVYYLLPTMKNADATLLKLAIAELAHHFQENQSELARHLTGLNLMLQRSETITEAERLATRQHLQPFAHLLNETLI